MKPTAIFLFISSLAIGTTITLASYHWILAWIGLEINTLAIIPLMMKLPHPRAIEAATKYFLTQAAASALMLFTALVNTWAFGEWDIPSLSTSLSIPLTIAISMKLGLAPLHFWMPEVLQGIPLATGLILSTWQKIAPLALFIQISSTINTFLISTLSLTSIIVGGWGGMNQTQLRKIMAYSSIGHMGWMTLIIKFDSNLTILNMLLYVLMTLTMFLFLLSMNITKMTQISSAWPLTPTLSILALLTLLSLGGLPPFSGFIPKFLIVMELITKNNLFLASGALLASLPTLYFYIRLTYTMLLTIAPNTSPSKTLWRLPIDKSPIIPIMASLTLLLLPLMSTITTILF
uniref:NADH-ubiquinone oxidoreductase chain 2 n=1 Tax=Otophryne sp. AMNH 101748 TaxID=2877825 RepID=A0A8K1HA15_9NEOB|nr:NADH dehydrogenase subunit 2 [Otophryne sp. AMNH 101748]